MEYRVLGKLEAIRDGAPVDLGTRRQRAVLALLLTAPNTVWSTDRIIDGVWGDDVGADRQNALWVYISGLRKALEPDREKRTEGTILLTRSPGYLLDVDPDEVDAVRFERLIAEGRSLVDADPAAASLLLGEALSLWRGRAYEDFAYDAFAQNEIARLDGLRLEAVEARIDADLLRGMSRELVSELETLVREHPLQERLTGQLMLALRRSGRQAESLRSYQALRSRLGEELGIEPSTEIRRLEERIVTGDQTLDVAAHARVTGPQPGLAVRGYELRDRMGERGSGVLYRAFQPSVGREVAIKVVRPELANDPTFIRRFEAEAQLVARLEHPHIVPLYDYWREPGAAYLVMRLMKGGTLADRIERGALTAEQASRLAEQIGGALDAAHRAGIVHREVMTTNVLFDDDGNAYLADFAIAGADDATTVADLEHLAALMTEAVTGMVGPVGQIRGALTPAVRRVVDRVTGDGPGSDAVDIAAFVADLREALGAAPTGDAPIVEVENPYKGLRAFDGADADNFFGRERLVERLLARLADAAGRFVAVVGPSGSGKSSVVRAGLLPAVRAGGLTGDWFTVEMTPAPHPFESLEDALLGVAIDPPTSLLEELVHGDDGIGRAVRRVLPDDGSRLLLVVDQFEELFTQVDAETADRFIAALVDALADARGRVSVVVTLRADFYDRPLRHRALGELIREGTEVITPMTPEELDRAITGPVERYGIEFERALVTDLVRDVVDRAGALPLLQYTLTELFDGRRGNRITHSVYRELGGVSGALVMRAEGLFGGLGDVARDVARQVFLRLITLGEGSDDTRRRVLRSELEQLAVERRLLDGVLETFGRHRLLSFDRDPVTRGPTVEISHEALLAEWRRLRDWIDAARHDVRNQRRLAEAMAEWSAAGSSAAYLLRGGRLDQLHGWAATTTFPLSAPEQQFLDASVAEAARVADEEREREQRAVDAERRERQRVRQLIAAGVVSALVAALAVFGVAQWRSAESARDEVEDVRIVNALASASSVVRADNPTLALLLAARAVREGARLGFATDESVDAVHWALQELGAQYDVSRDIPVAVRSGPNGPSGVYALSPAELVAVAESVTARSLSPDECASVYAGPCPDLPAIPPDLPLAGGASGYGAVPPDERALEGARISIGAQFYINEPGFELELAAFTEATGIEIELTRYDGNDWARILSGDIPRPDVLVFPGELPDWARDRALDLTGWLDHETLRTDFGDYLLNTSTVASGALRQRANTRAVGVPVWLDLHSMVYYPKAAFEAAGYEVPTTWDELVALSHQIVDDGRTPWCMGFAHAGSASVDGWPAADLIQDLVLRTGGVDAYDEWARGRIGFTSPEVLEAGRLADALVFEPGFVTPTPDRLAIVNWLDQIFTMLEPDPDTGAPPSCWFSLQRSFVLRLYGTSDVVIGEDVDYFPLPPVDPDIGAPIVGNVTLASGLTDRPEVRRLLEYFADPSFGSRWAPFFGDLNGPPPVNGYLAPNRRFDLASYGPVDDPLAHVKRRMVDDLWSAVDAGTLRGNTAEVMPRSIGGLSVRQNAFNAGMIDWVAGDKTIEEVFADIDAEWEAVKLRGEG